MEELVSIIVPVYNVERYLEQCINSIINQTYKNIEIILVDDSSPDNCGKMCDEYKEKDNRIKVIHKENGGVSSARNAGLKEATGDWVAFIDSDDWVQPDYIQELITVGRQEHADVILCGYNRISENKNESINSDGQKEELNSNQYLIRTLNPQTGFGFCHMKLIKKQIIQNTRFNESLVVGEDALFNIQISSNITKAVLYKKPLYNYRNNSNSVVKKYDPNYAQKYLTSMKQNKEYLLNNYNQDQIILQNYYNFVAYHVMLIAVNYCYHPQNPVRNKTKLLKEVCNYAEFKEAIAKSNFENISLTRKITLFTIKYKLYFATAFICKYRQRQNGKG